MQLTNWQVYTTPSPYHRIPRSTPAQPSLHSPFQNGNPLGPGLSWRKHWPDSLPTHYYEILDHLLGLSGTQFPLLSNKKKSGRKELYDYNYLFQLPILIII